MQLITSTIPPQNLTGFQVFQSSCKYQISPLNPSAAKISNSRKTAAPFDVTRRHLANLDKLLKKTDPPTMLEPESVRKDPNKGSIPIKGKGLLQDLNLARIWPGRKAAEDMSPKNLNRLHQLLSKTVEYSPKSSLGQRWREYHGCNNWSGLLDPLDENLRREVVRYGEFVQAAYQSFYSNPATSPNEAPLPHHVALLDRSYKVTKSLYATASVGLPGWVDEVAPDISWMTQRSSWVGYVAVCDDRREIARMGRRDIVIALRGTATCLEWAENFRAYQIKIPADNNTTTDEDSKVECGFLSLYKTAGAHVKSLSESVLEEIKRLTELYRGETLSITVTGHSLGAALAVLMADEISVCSPEIPPVAVFSFGGPRVGNKSFANRIESRNVKVLRIVNSQDVITQVPPVTYSHVGTELRVDTKMSPYLKPNADVACCHDLEAYLHLVDGFLSSKCPFRPNAKRSLARLMQDQKGNVKKLYMSKVKDLGLNPELQTSGCLPSPS
ncbi:phospholipase A1-Ibeta2, chloroplastic-like [Cucurbita moschata]|uniref:Phospholipase A1-Ibeta2, chloroplastic-like n=1 Tax=Cucurbita moschata TaxID=3662 RepID=A0A6J1H4Q9_CUCMO|nr:phospholipase A1-Ibeta2, chloroplastic-like [Cucurbita moschata]